MAWKHGFIAGVGILALAAAAPYTRLGRRECLWRVPGQTLRCDTATQVLMMAPAGGVGDTSRAAKIGIGDTSAVVSFFVADCLKVFLRGVGDTSYRTDRAGGHKQAMRCRWLRDGVGCATGTSAVVVDTTRLSLASKR
jgi:hypothetical protein